MYRGPFRADTYRMRITRIILLVSVLTAASLAGTFSTSVRADEPLRSGTIVGSYIETGQSHNCEGLPDCLAWLTSECDPALAGKDPAWLTSIVDVAELAEDRQPRKFAFSSQYATAHQTFVQFWTDGCREIRGARAASTAAGFEHQKTLSIPADAKWMTVSGDSGVRLLWTLK